MSKEKQIEEMTELICDNYANGKCATDGFVCNRNCEYKDRAERLYNAGYRKQIEGEWIWINQATGYLDPPYGDTCKCSLCEFVIDVSESNYKYCPNCGAKMRKEDEGK